MQLNKTTIKNPETKLYFSPYLKLYLLQKSDLYLTTFHKTTTDQKGFNGQISLTFED